MWSNALNFKADFPAFQEYYGRVFACPLDSFTDILFVVSSNASIHQLRSGMIDCLMGIDWHLTVKSTSSSQKTIKVPFSNDHSVNVLLIYIGN